jgi:hypothetical protein
MPRLPDAEDLRRSAPQSRRGIVTNHSGEILGNTLQQVGAQRAEADDKFAYALARNTVLSADLAARKQLENDPDWGTYEQRYTESLQADIKSAAGQIRNNRDRALFEQEAKLDVERGAVGIRQQARAKEVDWGRAGVDSGLASSREAAMQAKDPNLRWAYIDNVKALLKGAQQKGYIDQAEAESQWQRWSVDYADGLLDTYDAAKQVELLSNPNNPESPNKLLPADRVAVRLKAAEREVEAMRREAEAEQRAKLTEGRQAMTDRMRDMQVAAQMGIPVDVPPRATLRALYGDQEGDQRFKTAQRLATLSADVSSLQHLPADELIAKVQSYQPTQVEGAAEKAQLQAALGASAGRILEQRAKDPAGYLTQNSPTVRKAWDAMSRDPATAPQYVAAVRAEKERLGIPGNALVPDSYVAHVADDIAGTSAEKLADRLEEEAHRWGSAWPQVYGQIAGKLPDTAAVIASGIPKSAATALASMSGLKPADLKAMIPANVKPADIDESISDQFGEFVRSMPPEAARTVSATLEAANRLTIKYMNDNMSRANAAKRAYRELVGSQYELRPIRGAVVRIPAGTSADAVETGAQHALQHFNVTSSMVEVPSGAAMTDEEYAGRLESMVRSRGYWMTNPSATGLRLYLDGQPVERNREPVDVPWQDLTTVAAPQVHNFDDYADFRGPQ